MVSYTYGGAWSDAKQDIAVTSPAWPPPCTCQIDRDGHLVPCEHANYLFSEVVSRAHGYRDVDWDTDYIGAQVRFERSEYENHIIAAVQRRFAIDWDIGAVRALNHPESIAPSL